MKKAIHIDWLSVQYLGKPWGLYPWTFKKLPYACKEFRELYDVYLYNELFGHYSTCPSLPSLPNNLGILKIENKFCYSGMISKQLLDFKVQNGLEYKGLSRVDICSDFSAFENNRSPENVIKKYMAGEWDCLNKMSCQCARGPKGTSPFESLTFGSRCSNVRIYLYNKTKEMKDKTFKPWIYEADKKAGIDVQKDIWRLEFSIKGDAKVWTNEETGELVKLELDRVLNDEFLVSFYDCMCRKYFRFIEATTNKNRFRNESFDLFGTEPGIIRRVRITKQQDVTRADRIFGKKLWNEIDKKNPMDPADRPAVVNWAYNWARDHYLLEYIQDRSPQLTW